MNLPIHAQLINLMAALLLLIAFAMLSQRRIMSLIYLFAWQGAVLFANTMIVAWGTGQTHLFYSALITLVLKVIVLPWLLHRLATRLQIQSDVETMINIPITMLIGIVLVIFAFNLALPISQWAQTITRSTLGIAIASVLLSFLMMIMRRKAVPQVIGFLSMENGLFFAATSTTYGMPIVHHGGATFGYHSDMMWLPEHGVGAVILTNGDLGVALHGQFRRKLLELLFDGKSEAAAVVAATAKNQLAGLEAERKQIVVPADATEVAKLAPKYHNAELGDLAVKKAGKGTQFDMGEWKIEVGTRKHADGSLSFVTTGAGLIGIDFVTGTNAAGKPTLTVRDAQHEYVFEAR